MEKPIDALGRPLRDLRISVTDRCNFRCSYCMPREVFGTDFEFLSRQKLLSFEEIDKVVQSMLPLGLKKLRITGGEPLLRRDLHLLIQMLSKYNLDLAMTTNGALLAKQVADLAAAGLKRVTISIDALDTATFALMNDVEIGPEVILEGIDAAQAVGLDIKINAVIRRGVNEHAILELARYFSKTPHILRFIEFMDVGTTNGWRLDDVVSGEEILNILSQEFNLSPMRANYAGEVASRYALSGGGEIGIISSVSKPFCGSCNRARLSADGGLHTCLFSTAGHDLRGPVRAGMDGDELSAHIGEIWRGRDDRYSEIRGEQTVGLRRVEMSYIGG